MQSDPQDVDENAIGLRRHRRAVSPIVGVVLLVGITVALAAVVAIGVGSLSLAGGPSTAAFGLTVDADDSTVTIEHVGGESIDVEALSVTIIVEDTPLSDQPPVPFVGANGFEGAPTGPFNTRSSQEWRSGTTAGVTIADVNSPEIEPGDSVRVTLTVGDEQIGSPETTAT